MFWGKVNKGKPEGPGIPGNKNAKGLHDRYHSLLRKYGIAPNGDNFHKEGYIFTDKNNAEEHVRHKIKPLFRNLHMELEDEIAEVRKKVDVVDEQIKICKEKLNGSAGDLHVLSEKIKTVEAFEEEMEPGAFSKKKTKKAINDLSAKLEGNLAKLANENNADSEVIATFLQQKELAAFTRQYMELQKKLNSSLLYRIHSTFYPPKKSYYIGGYICSLVFFMAEIGFSMNIVSEIMDTGNYFLDLGLSACYAIAISLSMALVFKKLIDYLLFRSPQHAFAFWTIITGILGILMVLFSYDTEVALLSYTITNTALILSFFCCFFAIANAFAFREASYLHHLYTDLNKYGASSSSLIQERDDHIKQHNSELDELNKKKSRLAVEVKAMTNDATTRFKQMLSNLEEISIASFWKGFHKRAADTASGNNGIVHVITQAP